MSAGIFYFLIAAFAAFMGAVLGTRGAGAKRPVIGGGISLICYAVAVLFGFWGLLEIWQVV